MFLSEGRARSWLTAVSLLRLAGQTLQPILSCGNNVAGFLDLQPLLFRFSCSFTQGPPALGLAGTKSCNLIASSETKDPFSIPSSKEALYRAPGSLSPSVTSPCKTLTPQTDALADSVHAVPLQTGHPSEQQESEKHPPRCLVQVCKGTTEGLTQRKHGGPRANVNCSCQHGQKLVLQDLRAPTERGLWGK